MISSAAKNMTISSLIEIQELLSKKDMASWDLCWGQLENDTDIRIKYYGAYITGLVKLISDKKVKRVILISKDRAYFLAGFLAALHAGVGVVISQTDVPSILQNLLQPGDSILTDQESLVGTIDCCISMKNVNFDSDSITAFEPFNPDQSFITFYTSGSTGDPKPIVKSITQLNAEVSDLHSKWGLNKGVFISTVPHYHLYSLMFSLLWPVCSGYPLRRFTYCFWEELLADCVDNNYIISSPIHLCRLPSLEQGLQKPIEYIFSAGAVLPPAAIETSQNVLGVTPTEIYGSTETGCIAYRQQFKAAEPWTAFQNVMLKSGIDNKLCVKSDYLPNADYFQTEDMVSFEDDNKFHLLGRADRIAKIEGKRISLVEIEQKLQKLDIFNKIVVLEIKTEIRAELGIIATLSNHGQHRLDVVGKTKFINENRQYLRTYFDGVVVPKKWRFVDEMPVNEQGKSPQSLLKSCFM